jgi:RNA:NAD 2'-phosphotransferase (TPT1/KptA family)
MKVYHVTSSKKYEKYKREGRIKSPVRAWVDIFEAVRFSCQTGRPIILRLKFPNDVERLPSHGGNAVVLHSDFSLENLL